jgi:hypothetical protein
MQRTQQLNITSYNTYEIRFSRVWKWNRMNEERDIESPNRE